LYITLALKKNFIKAMDENSAGFMYLKNESPRISDVKIKEGVFVRPQIRVNFVAPQIRVNTGRKI
jgi:hypothetical protein